MKKTLLALIFLVFIITISGGGTKEQIGNNNSGGGVVFQGAIVEINDEAMLLKPLGDYPEAGYTEFVTAKFIAFNNSYILL